MKKIFIALLATAILFAAVGCGSENGGKDEVRTVDISSAAQALAVEITFEDEIAPIDDEAVRYLYDLPDGVKAAVYSSSGATAEELALFDAGDESTAKAVLSVAREHIQSQLESFKNYNPDETDKLEKAVVKQFGQYVALCVTSDAGAAAAVDKIFG